jgi:hypothetical protein
MQDVGVSVLIKFLAVVTWCDKYGVIKNETDFSAFLFITWSPVYNKIVFSTNKKKKTGERAKISYKIEHVFIWTLSSSIERISPNSSINIFCETRRFSSIQKISFTVWSHNFYCRNPKNPPFLPAPVFIA